MRKPLVRHVSAIQVQMRQPAQRGDRLQARVADACGCGRWRHSVSAGVRRVAGGLNSVQPLQSGGAGAAVADAGDSRGQNKRYSLKLPVCKAMYR